MSPAHSQRHHTSDECRHLSVVSRPRRKVLRYQETKQPYGQRERIMHAEKKQGQQALFSRFDVNTNYGANVPGLVATVVSRQEPGRNLVGTAVPEPGPHSQPLIVEPNEIAALGRKMMVPVAFGTALVT